MNDPTTFDNVSRDLLAEGLVIPEPEKRDGRIVRRAAANRRIKGTVKRYYVITFKVFFGCEIENLEDQIGLGHDGHFHRDHGGT